MSYLIGSAGAETVISGEISIHSTWSEDIYFFQSSDGSAMDLTGLDFRMQFRCSADQENADVTLSIDAGTLSIEEDDGSVDSILRITVPAGTFSAYDGDMVCDLIGIDQSDNITHYGHGLVTFRNSPVAI
jgi:hypothetical protein